MAMIATRISGDSRCHFAIKVFSHVLQELKDFRPMLKIECVNSSQRSFQRSASRTSAHDRKHRQLRAPTTAKFKKNVGGTNACWGDQSQEQLGFLHLPAEHFVGVCPDFELIPIDTCAPDLTDAPDPEVTAVPSLLFKNGVFLSR